MNEKGIFEDLSNNTKVELFEKQNWNLKDTALRFYSYFFDPDPIDAKVIKYQKLNGSELKWLYEIIEDYPDILAKTKQLYQKQGFLVYKQSQNIENIIDKRKNTKDLKEAEKLYLE